MHRVSGGGGGGTRMQWRRTRRTTLLLLAAAAAAACFAGYKTSRGIRGTMEERGGGGGVLEIEWVKVAGNAGGKRRGNFASSLLETDKIADLKKSNKFEEKPRKGARRNEAGKKIDSSSSNSSSSNNNGNRSSSSNGPLKVILVAR